MTCIYNCPDCDKSVELKYPKSIYCPKCDKPMEQVAQEKWLHKCQQCDYTHEAATPKVVSCPLCGGSVCPSKPID